MNREILFRAKSIQTGRWIFGYYFEDKDSKSYIGYMSKKRYIPDTLDWEKAEYYENNPTYNWVFVKEEVVTETVGEYTGLTDKNGVKIFEGDIIRNIESDIKALVQFFSEHTAFMVWIHNELFSINQVEYLGEMEMSEVEVIGNIYDNHELIGEDGEQNG